MKERGEGGKLTIFDPGIVNAVASGVVSMIRGVNGAWFGPGQPLTAVAPKEQPIRQRDYPYSFNLSTNTRYQETGISFAQLRALVQNYGILSTVIETRKDQAVKMPWAFRLRREEGESKKKHAARSSADARIKKLNDMFRYPDTEMDWRTWFRSFLDEVFVTDALSIAPMYTLGREIYGLELIDGATIERKLDAQGRTPKGETDVAYQQMLKGLPAKDLSRRDLIYRPRNVRTYRSYGFSPVEQIIVIVNMGLRRELTQLAHFTDGNVPEALAQTPDNWTPPDIKRMQQQFDAMQGSLVNKSRIKFIPKLEDILFPKEKMLSDGFDEWLARIVCFAFSISPQPFVKMMNRATADNAGQQAQDEGLIPILDYASGVINYAVEKYMGYTDIEHSFRNEEEFDKLKQAQIDKIYFDMAKVSGDELRERDGEEPIGLGHFFMTATGPIPAAPFLKGGAMADGLPQHVKTPEELDQIQADSTQANNDHQMALTQAKGGTVAEEKDPTDPKAKGKKKDDVPK